MVGIGATEMATNSVERNAATISIANGSSSSSSSSSAATTITRARDGTRAVTGIGDRTSGVTIRSDSIGATRSRTVTQRRIAAARHRRTTTSTTRTTTLCLRSETLPAAATVAPLAATIVRVRLRRRQMRRTRVGHLLPPLSSRKRRSFRTSRRLSRNRSPNLRKTVRRRYDLCVCVYVYVCLRVCGCACACEFTYVSLAECILSRRVDDSV
jgi:hypothetical protein